MNVLAGIIIGIVNDSWSARLVVPFLWGIVFLLHTTIFRHEEKNLYLKRHPEGSAKWGMSQTQAFYFIEYMTAVSTSLTFSITAGFIRDLFLK